MTYLKRCISLALLSQASFSSAGELVVSPTLELNYLNVQMDDERPNSYEHDNVLNGLLDTTFNYSTNYWESELVHEISTYQYSENKDADLVMNEISWDNEFTFIEDRFSLGHHWKRYREVYDGLDGAFDDDLYNMKGDSVRNVNDISANYIGPANWPFIFSVEGGFEDERINPDDESVDDSRLLTRSGNFSVSDKKVKGVYWSAQGSRSEQDKKDGLTFTQDSGNVVVRIPTVSKINITGKGSVSRYESSTQWEYGGNSRKVRTIVTGVGLGWVKTQNQSFFEATYDRVDDSDDGVSYSWGAEFAWAFADRWSLSGKKTARFYGDSYAASLIYTGENSELSISQDEDVRQRYVPVPRLELEGVYACSVNEEGEYVFDPSFCTLIDNEDFELEDGQVAIPNIQQQFPLEPRLNLEKSTTVSWRFKAKKWDHTLSLSKRDDEDLTSQLSSNGYEGRFDADYRLSSDSYLRMKWQYSDIEVGSRTVSRSISRVGSLGFHKELNTRAEWSVTLKTTSQDNRSMEYDDYRVILGYQHFFGEKHKKRRSF